LQQCCLHCVSPICTISATWKQTLHPTLLATTRLPQERLMEHLKLFSTRLNVPQLIRVCEELELWKELTFL
jgi:hypothetical protein